MSKLDESRIPVLVGCGQITEKNVELQDARNPVEMISDSARLAAEDCGIGDKAFTSLGAIATMGLSVDAAVVPNPLTGSYANLPKSIANNLGIEAEEYFYSTTGGNTPQMLVNKFSEKIAEGIIDSVLLCGGEALNTMMQLFNTGGPLETWFDSPGGEPTMIGDARPAGTDLERGYNLSVPSNVYPLFENALQHHYGRNHKEHMRKLGELYSPLSEVAVDNPLSWFPQKRTPEELISVNEKNRYIAFPYPKLLNSIIMVNQSASIIMMSLQKAKSLGIDENCMVYLHGCGDANDIWDISDRINYHSSPAIRRIGEEALEMAGKTIDDIDYLDIYSCFPSAVQIACDELGIAHDDPRGLTVTGGLPYFGGPGNNYTMHAIAEMMNTLRANPGKYGLLNANGWFITKHSLGIYSTSPIKTPWKRKDPTSYQQELLDQESPNFVAEANGNATIETFTVLFDRTGPEHGIVIGRLDSGNRFIAKTKQDNAIFHTMTKGNIIGKDGTVECVDGVNIFSF